MEYDSHAGMKVMYLLEDAVFLADVNSAPIDMEDAAEGLGYESLTYLVQIGIIATAGGVIDCRPQEADVAGGPWNDVPEQQVIGGEALSAANAGSFGIKIPSGAVLTAYRVGSVSKKRHQRLALTQETAVTAGQVSVTAILGHPRNGPVADQSS